MRITGQDHWAMIPLDQLLVQSEETTEIQPDRRYRQVTVRLWGQGVVLRDEVSGARISAKKRRVVRAEQFILSRIDARNGAFGLVTESLDGAVVSNDFPAFNVNRQRLEPRFLAWMSKTEGFVNLCRAASEGTTDRVRLKVDRFLEMPISLPPLTEQHRIVARIEELAALIEEAQGLRIKAREEANAFIVSLHLRQAQGRVMRLGEVLELDEYREAVETGRNFPQVGIRGFGQGLFAKEALEASQTSYKAFNRLYEGAVVLSQPKGWEGAIAICPAELDGKYVSPEYRTFRCVSGKAKPGYLAEVFATSWFWIQLKNLSRGLGARRQRTRPEQFLAMELPMPTIDQQEQALPILKDLHELTSLQEATQPALHALLPPVLDRAFKGEL